MTLAGDPSPSHVEAQLDRWYDEKARHRLPERVADCWQSVPSAALERFRLRLRRMRTRRGSLSNAGTLSLQPDLVRAPRDCIDYVIIHELCHLVHADHGREFRGLLERVLPDWQRRKHMLEVALM